MFGDSVAAVTLAWVVLAFLGALFALRLRVLLRRRRRASALPARSPAAFSWRELVRVRDSSPGDASLASLAAAFFGVLAIVSLGVGIPLEIIDGAVGGSNQANLVQSLLAVCAFWFFRDAVKGFAVPKEPRYRIRLLVVALTAIAVPFFLIHDRGTTSAQFMAEHADQLPNVVYNVIYMSVLAWIVADMAWALRNSGGIYAVFLVGLCVIWLSCVDEIAYICLAHFAPGAASDFTYLAFYFLFFGGILVVAGGWSWVLVAERDYVGGILWRFRSAALTAALFRVRRRSKKQMSPVQSLDDAGPVHPEPVPGTERGEPGKPRLLVAQYKSPSGTSKTLSVIPTDTLRETVRTLLGANSEDVAYRLVVQIRNTANRHNLKLTAREEERLARVEEFFPGFEAPSS
jgi:hypothetical protein